MTIPEEIASCKYISLESYRKNNQPVRTPVWFVIKNNSIIVVTREQTGKVKRIRRSPQVRIAACTIKGKITGEWVSGTATILKNKETTKAVEMGGTGLWQKLQRS